MKRIIAVVSAERAFTERFCDYINNNGHIVFSAVPFFDMESLRGYRKEHEVPVLLCDSEFLRDEVLLSDFGGIRTIPLCEDRRTGEEEKAIYKYQSAEAIVREIMDCLGDDRFTGGMSFTGRPVSVVGIYSPGLYEMKTSFALAMAAELRKKRKVLFLNFDEFSGLSELAGAENPRGLSNMLYYLKQGTLTGQRILSMVYSLSGFDYVPPVRFADDYSAITGEECARLVQTVFSETLYDTVVADLPPSFMVSSDVLDLCEAVYLPSEELRESAGRIRAFENYLVLSGRTKLLGKIRKVRIPHTEIPEKKALTGSEYVDLLSLGRMGEICQKEVAELGDGQ